MSGPRATQRAMPQVELRTCTSSWFCTASGSATALPFPVYIDGLLLSPNTRGGLFNAITDDEYHIIEIRGFTWTSAEVQILCSGGGMHCPVAITNTAGVGYADALAERYILAEMIRDEIIAGN